MQLSKKFTIGLTSLALVAGAAGTIALQTHAASDNTSSSRREFARPDVGGTVSAISGNILTVVNHRDNTTYTVDASAATIEKISASTSGQFAQPARASITDIVVGDHVMVQGTVNGTAVSAKKIVDGMPMMRGHGPRGHIGTVSAVSGNTITLTGQDGQTYTVDASAASVKKVSSSSISDIAVGDQLMVQGATSGSNITAKSLVDGELFTPPGQQ